MTPAQAFKAAMLGALFYETIQMGKVWPGGSLPAKDYYEDAMLEFNKLSPRTATPGSRKTPVSATCSDCTPPTLLTSTAS